MPRSVAIVVAVVAFATIASPAAASAGLVGRWQLNEGSGRVAADSSGFGDNGALSAGVSWTTGPHGAALSFAGVNGGVRIPDSPQLEPSGAVSVAAWVARTGSPGVYKYVLAKGGSGCIAASYGLYSGPTGGLEFYVSRGHGTTYARSADAGAGVWDARWHLAVGTFDGTTIRLYVDGVAVGFGTVYPGPIEYLLSSANDLYIGAYPSCANQNFDGTISDVRVWDRALTPTEVASLPTMDQLPPTAGGNPGGMPAPPSGKTGSGGGQLSGGGTARWPSPVISKPALFPTIFTVRAGADSSGRAGLIVYRDPYGSQVTFTILRVQGRVARTRCIAAARRAHRAAAGYCPRYLALNRFVHKDTRGRNVVQFPRALRPPPGSYILDVTPSLNGNVGKTVVIPFKVVASRRGR